MLLQWLLNALSCWHQAYHAACAFTAVAIATPNMLTQRLDFMMAVLFHIFSPVTRSKSEPVSSNQWITWHVQC